MTEDPPRPDSDSSPTPRPEAEEEWTWQRPDDGQVYGEDLGTAQDQARGHSDPGPPASPRHEPSPATPTPPPFREVQSWHPTQPGIGPAVPPASGASPQYPQGQAYQDWYAPGTVPADQYPPTPRQRAQYQQTNQNWQAAPLPQAPAASPSLPMSHPGQGQAIAYDKDNQRLFWALLIALFSLGGAACLGPCAILFVAPGIYCMWVGAQENKLAAQHGTTNRFATLTYWLGLKTIIFSILMMILNLLILMFLPQYMELVQMMAGSGAGG